MKVKENGEKKRNEEIREKNQKRREKIKKKTQK